MRLTAAKVLLPAVATLLAACSGDDGGDDTGGGSTIPLAPVIHTVGGTISGLAGSGLMLQINGSNTLEIRDNGDFAFTAPLGNGTRYTVTVLTQPARPAQTCAVTDGSGTVASANVTNVEVTCTTNTFTVGGTVAGLAGAGLVLQNNAGSNLAISAPGTFTFPDGLTTGTLYDVTILSQPSVGASQTCVVTNGRGTVTNTLVTSVVVTCTLNISNLFYSVAVGALLLAATSAPGVGAVFAADAMHETFALVMPVTY